MELADEPVDSDWSQDARDRANSLSPDAAAVAMAVLDTIGSRTRWPMEAPSVGLRRLLGSLDSALAADRAAVFAALHPELAPALTIWWADEVDPSSEGVFDSSYGARTPGRFEASLDRRCSELTTILSVAGPYRHDVMWFDAHAALISVPGGLFSLALSDVGAAMFAAAVPFDHLLAVVTGEVQGAIGKHSVVGLLRSGRDEGLSAARTLLLDAAREEGLRQAIFEAAAVATPSAFRYVMQVIIDHDLLRFESALRAVGSWTGDYYAVGDEGKALSALSRLHRFVGDAGARRDAVASGDLPNLALALRACAIVDSVDAISICQQILDGGDRDRRLAAISRLSQLRLEESNSALLAHIDDEDFEVAKAAQRRSRSARRDTIEAGAASVDWFDASFRLVDRWPDDSADDRQQRRYVLVRLLESRSGRSLDEFVPYLDYLGDDGRKRFVTEAKDEAKISFEVRAALIQILGKRGKWARRFVKYAFQEHQLRAEDAPALEDLLKTKSAAIRLAALEVLGLLPSAELRASADRLSSSRSGSQREAGADLLASLAAKADPVLEPAAVTLPEPADGRPSRSIVTPAAERLVVALDAFVETMADTEFVIDRGYGPESMLVRDADYMLDPVVLPQSHLARRVATEMLFGASFREWFDARPKRLRSSTGDEPLRALVSLRARGQEIGESIQFWPDDVGIGLAWQPYLSQDHSALKHPRMIAHVLGWLTYETTTGAGIDDCLDLCMQQARDLAAANFVHVAVRNGEPTVGPLTAAPWFKIAVQLLTTRPELATTARMERVWKLCRWLDDAPVREGMPGTRKNVLVAAADAGLELDDGEIEAVLGKSYQLLGELTGPDEQALRKRYPVLHPVAQRIRDQVVQAALTRGDLPAPTSRLSNLMSSVPGAETAMALLGRLGDQAFLRTGVGWGDGLRENLCTLLLVSRPLETDTGELLAAAADQNAVSDERLVEFAMYVPRWAQLIERATGWKGLDRAVYWMHAHTKEASAERSEEDASAWYGPLGPHTDLTIDQLLQGSIDVQWFREAYDALGPHRWAVVRSAAKLTTDGTGHRRAQLFSDVLIGDLDEASCRNRIEAKRDQNLVRAYGLLPLPSARRARRAAIVERYRYLCDFEASSKSSGPQRRVSERQAVLVGIENLARNVGYTNPLRFRWEMETSDLADLREGPLTTSVGDVDVSLQVGSEGAPELAIERSGRSLKSLPKAAKADADALALVARNKELRGQITRIRGSLEQAMAGGETFEPEDLWALQEHPLVAPTIERTVFVDERGMCCLPSNDRRLVSVAGRTIRARGTLRVAHPHDLLVSNRWPQWQRYLFEKRIRQPFRQVFREHYVMTSVEAQELAGSERYAGHQINPRQAAALLTARGWRFDHDNRVFSRPFRSEGVMARLTFDNGYYSDSGTSLPIVDSVEFSPLRSFRPIPLADVPAILFSEAMRDIDLVVSVAHATPGGIDPSASTVEMRHSLVVEFATMLGFHDQLSFSGNHVTVDGSRGCYRIHLGSGVVHDLARGQLVIAPVHAQQRGGLFLPYVDEDPRTAEVLSKLILLANDVGITDPSVLRQLGT